MSYCEIHNLRKENKLVEAFQLAYSKYLQIIDDDGMCPDPDLIRAFYWVCVDMVKVSKIMRNGSEIAIMNTLRILYHEMRNVTQMEKDAYGWSICRVIGDSMEEMGSLACRRMMVEYFAIGAEPLSRLHSYILSLASKMAMLFPDFQFVSFLSVWGLQNVIPNDNEVFIDEKTGRRYSSLLERTAKGYAYSLLFHDIDITVVAAYRDADKLLRPYLTNMGYYDVLPMVATKLFKCVVRGRDMTFVRLVGFDGTEASAELQCVIRYKVMNWDKIENTMFRVLLKAPKNEESNPNATAPLVVEAMVPSVMVGTEKKDCERFGKAVGYVDHVDVRHGYIHVYDSLSRHFVAHNSRCSVSVGEFVEFIPIVPKESVFKTAVLTRVLSAIDGPLAFGVRDVRVTYVDSVNCYCAWELVDTEVPIREVGRAGTSFTKGFISQKVIQANGIEMPKFGEVISVIVFLKRGKDRIKKPEVVMIINNV